MRRFARNAPRPKAGLLAALAVLVLAGTPACSAGPEPRQPASAAGDAAGALQALDREIGDAACSQAAQCRTVAIGAKACGGPEAFRAWSTERSSQERVESLARRHTELRQARNAAGDLVSNCMVVTDPGAVCQAGRCVLGGSGRGAPTR